jgi:hypothetical protein
VDVLSLVHHTHAATPEFFDHAIVGNGGPIKEEESAINRTSLGCDGRQVNEERPLAG